MANKILLSLVLILMSFLFFIKLTGEGNIKTIEIFAVGFIAFGFLSVFNNLGKGNRGLLFISSSLFVIGFIIMIVHSSEIHSYENFTFASLLVSVGSSFLILYIDNPRVKAFIYSASLLLVLGFLAAANSSLLGIVPLANRYCNSLLNVYPVFIIISLVMIIFNNRTRADK